MQHSTCAFHNWMALLTLTTVPGPRDHMNCVAAATFWGRGGSMTCYASGGTSCPRLEVWSKRTGVFSIPSTIRTSEAQKHLRNQSVPISSLTEVPFERLARIDRQLSTASKLFGCYPLSGTEPSFRMLKLGPRLTVIICPPSCLGKRC